MVLLFSLVTARYVLQHLYQVRLKTVILACNAIIMSIPRKKKQNRESLPPQNVNFQITDKESFWFARINFRIHFFPDIYVIAVTAFHTPVAVALPTFIHYMQIAVHYTASSSVESSFYSFSRYTEQVRARTVQELRFRSRNEEDTFFTASRRVLWPSKSPSRYASRVLYTELLTHVFFFNFFGTDY